MQETKFYLTIEETAKKYGIGETKLRKMVKKRSRPWAYFDGNRCRIIPEEFEKYLISANSVS